MCLQRNALIKLFNIKTGDVVWERDYDIPEYYRHLALSDDGKRAVFEDGRHSIKLFDKVSVYNIHEKDTHRGDPSTACMASIERDGQFMRVFSRDGYVIGKILRNISCKAENED